MKTLLGVQRKITGRENQNLGRVPNQKIREEDSAGTEPQIRLERKNSDLQSSAILGNNCLGGTGISRQITPI